MQTIVFVIENNVLLYTTSLTSAHLYMEMEFSFALSVFPITTHTYNKNNWKKNKLIFLYAYE